MKIPSTIKIYKKNLYNLNASNYIYKKILKCKNIVITSGNTIKGIYKYLDKKKIESKNFFLSDERIISYSSKYSNYKNLHKYKFLNKNDFNHFNIYKKFKKSRTEKFFKNINKKIDLSILSIGEGCHIASIFNVRNFNPNQKYFNFKDRHDRVTIPLKIFNKSKKIILLVTNKDRAKLLAHFYGKNLFIFKYLNKKKITFLFEEKTFKLFKKNLR